MYLRVWLGTGLPAGTLILAGMTLILTGAFTDTCCFAGILAGMILPVVLLAGMNAGMKCT